MCPIFELLSMFPSNFVTHKSEFFFKYSLSTMKMWGLISEDFIIPNYPNGPSSKNDYFHAECDMNRLYLL
jgi:hypothetical protein